MSNQFVQLKDNGNNLFPKTALIGIDTNNLLATHTNKSITYTATQDAIAVCKIISGGEIGYILLDNVEVVCDIYSAGNYTNIGVFSIKKGQVLSFSSVYISVECKIFGLKYI